MGEALALLGAGTLFADLFRPWYEFRLPAGTADKLPAGGGPLGELIRQGLRAIESAGAVPLDAWTIYRGLDVTLAALAIATAMLVALSAAGREYALGFRAEGGIVVAGVAVALLVGWRIVDQPGPSEVLQLRSGIWVALCAGVAMAAGGRIAFKAPRPPAPTFSELQGLPPLPSKPSPVESTSVPPPGGE